ncbi:uncharacterized protein ACN427_008851 [Glossina fuscipes fuscipes]
MIKFVILSIICYFVPKVWGDCVLRIPENKENVPLWEKKIGDSWFKIPYVSDHLQLQKDEVVNGYCATKFKEIAYDVSVAVHCKPHDRDCPRLLRTRTDTKHVILNERNMTLVCAGNGLQYKSDILGDHPLACDDIEWTINVEANQNDDSRTFWCKSDHQIFDLRTNNLDQNRLLAKICFRFSLQSIKYKSIKRKSESWNEKKLLPVVITDLPEVTTPSSEVKFLNTTILYAGNEAVQSYFKMLNERNPWLNLAHYEYGNIVQDDPFINSFNQYNQLLDILWWTNLRLTNWQRFLNALQQHTIDNSYDIYMGTLNVVQVPLWPDPNEFEYMEIKNGFVNSTVPQYIWTYLESSDGKNPDLYIFAYNSPYAMFFNSSKVKFCSDICGEIDWLKSVRPSFDYSNFGIIFCCTNVSVQNSEYAKQLPYKLAESDLNIRNGNNSAQEENKQTLEVTNDGKQGDPNQKLNEEEKREENNVNENKIPGSGTIKKPEKPKIAEGVKKTKRFY